MEATLKSKTINNGSIRSFVLILSMLLTFNFISATTISLFTNESYASYNCSFAILDVVNTAEGEDALPLAELAFTGVGEGSALLSADIPKFSIVEDNKHSSPCWLFVKVVDQGTAVASKIFSFAAAHGFNRVDGHPEMYNRDVDDEDGHAFIF